MLTIQKNGPVLFNGKPLIVSSDEEMTVDEDGIMPLAGSKYTYSFNAFPGTAGKYTGTASTHNNRNVFFGKIVRYMTGYAIGFGIMSQICPSSAADAGIICGDIGLTLKSKLEETADNSNALSYKVTSRGVPGNNTFLSYRQFAGTYYTNANYTGKSLYRVFYEKRESLT